MVLEKKHNIFYRTTNQVNWKYYFGVHSTDNLNDGYIGSGTALKLAIEKYGIDNFHMTIIMNYSTRKEAFDHERLAVGISQITNKDCYNIRPGGDNEYVLGSVHSDEQKEKWSVDRRGEKNNMFGKHHTDETKRKISIANTGKRLNEETIEKLKQGHRRFFETIEGDIYRLNISIRVSGNKNPFYGRSHTQESKNAVSNTKIEKYNTDEFLEYTKLAINTRRKNGTLLHRLDSRKKISTSLIGNDRRCGYECIINGVYFETVSLALKELDVSKYTLRKRLNSVDDLWKNWFYIKDIIDNNIQSDG